MDMKRIDTILERQESINTNQPVEATLPKYDIYAISSLRGGVGKTTLAYNLSFMTDNLLVVDTCPQGNLSEFLDIGHEYIEGYETDERKAVYDMIVPYFVTGLNKLDHVAAKVRNKYFREKNSYLIPSSERLYMFPSQFYGAIVQTDHIQAKKKQEALNNMLYSLRTELEREMGENKLNKCLIDCSPFIAGATKLAWYGADSLIVPIRPDGQSIKSLELMMRMLTNLKNEVKGYLGKNEIKVPKIQMVVLTHCDYNEPENQIIIEKLYTILCKNRELLSTNIPEHHLVMVDDFNKLGLIEKPIDLLKIKGNSQNLSNIIKNQLNFISSQLWKS